MNHAGFALYNFSLDFAVKDKTQWRAELNSLTVTTGSFQQGSSNDSILLNETLRLRPLLWDSSENHHLEDSVLYISQDRLDKYLSGNG